MQLNKQLILFRYILGQFGYDTFEALRDDFNNQETGTSSTGYTFFAATIMSNPKKKVEDGLVQLYDDAIQGYEKKLRENRAEPFFSFKYYQWFSLLFTEFFFDLFEGKELFVLRNLSVKGIGFFMESSSFYPDFILWVVDKNKQHIYFLDPKGILLGDNHFNNPKILWCKESTPKLEQKIQQELTKDKKNISVSVSAFILSDTAFNEVRDRWGEGTGTTKQDFANNNVLFIENNKDYLIRIFKNLEE